MLGPWIKAICKWSNRKSEVRVNINILGISDLRWTGIGEFNSDDHYIYYCGKESLRRNIVVIIVNKRIWNVVLGCNLKNNRMISVPFQGKPFNNGNTNLCPKCWRSWSWMVLWRPIRPSRTNTQKRCPFHYGGQECKTRKSRDTWSNRQIWPWSTKWSSSKTNRVLPRESTAHGTHPLPTTQEKTLHMDITRWSILK